MREGYQTLNQTIKTQLDHGETRDEKRNNQTKADSQTMQKKLPEKEMKET